MANKETARGGRLTSQKSTKSTKSPSTRTGKSAKKPAAPAAKGSRPPAKPTASKAKTPAAKNAPAKNAGKAAPAKSRGAKSPAARGTITKHETTAQQVAAWSATFRQNLKDPAYWERLRRQMPPWADELGGLLLIVAGVIALTALFNSTTEAVLAVRAITPATMSRSPPSSSAQGGIWRRRRSQ